MCAKFRRNHVPRKGGSGFVKLLIFAIILLISLYYLSIAIGNLDLEQNTGDASEASSSDIIIPALLDLAQSTDCQVIDHEYFKLCYNEAFEQPLWVGYMLTKTLLDLPNVERVDWYTEDNLVSARSAHHRDYTRSGFTRGHLVPAADMAFSKPAMRATFNMSNISPQLAGFNGGIWRELEELVRDWTILHDTLYIVTGPVIREPKEWIGKTSEVAVPEYFYKAIMNDNWEAIGFVLPHNVSAQPIMDYAVSIDSLEAFTGLEIFDDLLDDDIEVAVEEQYETGLWPVDAERYQRRIKKWNNQ